MLLILVAVAGYVKAERRGHVRRWRNPSRANKPLSNSRWGWHGGGGDPGGAGLVGGCIAGLVGAGVSGGKWLGVSCSPDAGVDGLQGLMPCPVLCGRSACWAGEGEGGPGALPQPWGPPSPVRPHPSATQEARVPPALPGMCPLE